MDVEINYNIFAVIISFLIWLDIDILLTMKISKKTIKTKNELFIENLSNTNFTYVNNKKILEKTKLQDGDEIGLGGTNLNGKCQEQAAYFLVRIGQCI